MCQINKAPPPGRYQNVAQAPNGKTGRQQEISAQGDNDKLQPHTFKLCSNTANPKGRVWNLQSKGRDDYDWKETVSRATAAMYHDHVRYFEHLFSCAFPRRRPQSLGGRQCALSLSGVAKKNRAGAAVNQSRAHGRAHFRRGIAER